MKKETKRYSLVEYLGKTYRVVDNNNQYNELVNFIKKINRRESSELFYGNLSKERVNDKYLVTIHLYNRLTPAMEISFIKNALLNCNSYRELCYYYENKTREYNPDIYIAYFETINKNMKTEKDCDVGIKPLELFFAQDSKYFEPSYIKQCFDFRASVGDMKFFKDLCNRICQDKSITQNIENLRKAINIYEVEKDYNNQVSTQAYKLYNFYICEKDKYGKILKNPNGKYETSTRRMYDIASFVRDYNMNRVPISATRFNVKRDPRNKGNEPKGQELILKSKRNS